MRSLKAANKLGIIFFPAFDWAISPTHPEREERLLYTQDQLKEEGIFDIQGITEYKPEVAQPSDIERTHFCFPDVDEVTTQSHYVSAGGAIKAAKLVMEKKEDKAFALVRPPGHHAMKVVHGGRGFCNINIEAVMLEAIREKYGRIRACIVDTDCHHGDGTQDIYWHDPDTLFISLHQDGRTIYPGTGFPREMGGPNALGKTVNIPLPPGTSDEGFLYVMENLVMPIIRDFKPQLIINSAGQDNHFTDPITNMNFSAQGYAKLNEMLNPDIAVLEGGYSIQGALPYVNSGIVLAMAGVDYSNIREPNFDPESLRQSADITEYIKELCDDIRKLYDDPPRKFITGEPVGNYLVRVKDIYYDTDGISDRQVEWIYQCKNCPGVLKVETKATGRHTAMGIEIPQSACERCRDEGYNLLEEAKRLAKYRYIQFNNRRDKAYKRIGF